MDQIVYWSRPHVGAPFWTKERVQQLSSYMAEGKSAAEIANLLGNTRSAIIGAAARRGLVWWRSQRASPGEKPKPRRLSEIDAARLERLRARARALSRPPRPSLLKARRLPKARPEPIARNIPLLDLTEGDCRWPTRDEPAAIGRFLFCGCQVSRGSPYCEAHLRRSVDRSLDSKWRASL